MSRFPAEPKGVLPQGPQLIVSRKGVSLELADQTPNPGLPYGRRIRRLLFVFDCIG